MSAIARLVFRIIATLVAIPVGKAITKATAQVWTKTRPENPPVDPKSTHTGWPDAVAWAALTGVGAAVAQLLTTRGADFVWRILTGHPAPQPKYKPTKAEKQAAKDEKKAAKQARKADKQAA